ncbi:MAG TPA: urease accessory protein UreD [Candidatus Saccharimonadales bacterium]|nr:urease accessory protein UreD [Candidatus Saccharimonadales bacterium]
MSFPFNNPQNGTARLTVELVSGKSAVTSAFAGNPLKLLTPHSRGKSVWACTSSFGGGLVAGDQTRLELRIRKNARCFLGTQASTKIYRNAGLRPCGHVTEAELEENSLLVFTPDPVQPFAHSNYSQRQEFHLASGAGLVLLDWFSSGRAARGERWQFCQFRSRNEVFAEGERIFLDSIFLDSSDGSLASSMRTGRYNCFATLVLAGRPLEAAVIRLLNNISARPIERKAVLVAAASPFRDGAVLRVTGETVEAVGRELLRHLTFLPEFLGDEPWKRKW